MDQTIHQLVGRVAVSEHGILPARRREEAGRLSSAKGVDDLVAPFPGSMEDGSQLDDDGGKSGEGRRAARRIDEDDNVFHVQRNVSRSALEVRGRDGSRPHAEDDCMYVGDRSSRELVLASL
mmetsp:Transcript_6907/g.20728  ORF Transcript_6907/g.20728 Transcript_6907/m.20728 type:complete len:122 (+) Transcript_6907:596-961(+)